MKELHCKVEELREAAVSLRIYDKILLSGIVYTARDAAHKRIAGAIAAGESLPFPLSDGVIYYAGPTAAKPGLPIGSCGPTTSGRMDSYAPALLDRGLMAMIGKGPRNAAVIEAVARNGALYLCALGGAGALACRSIKHCEVVAYEDLGCESVKRLELLDFPLVVAIDSEGNSLFRA